MTVVARLLIFLAAAALLQACTAAGHVFDNNCSGNGFIDPGTAYCDSYTEGG
jgi:hypothetical protein